MITHLKVDGFRSLLNFEISLRSGLNVLVGPNGAGKTNIIDSFQFISLILRDGVTSAVNNLGGVPSILTRKEDGSLASEVRFVVRGNYLTDSTKDSLDIKYKYEFCLKLSNQKDFIRFGYQRLRVSERPNRQKPGQYKKTVDIVAERLSRANKKESWSVRFLKYPHNPNLDVDGQKGKFDLRYILRSVVGHRAENHSIVDLFADFFPRFRYMVQDLSFNEAINLSPTAIKKPDKSSEMAGVQKDGSGTAATLWAIQNYSSWERFQRHDLDTDENKLSKLLEFAKLANPDITKISASLDPVGSVLRVYVTLKQREKSVELPFDFMSDGTVKWISLILAVLTHKSLFAIEEPENYIHPAIQGELIKIIRNTINQRTNQNSVILTTHSETLLSDVKLNEIIMVSMNNGVSKVSRIANQEALLKAIEATGFSVGYSYLSGAFESE